MTEKPMDGQILPVKMQKNRVWRIYLGGKLLEEFYGEPEGEDGYFPEDWLASLVEANNMPREGKPPREGLCKTENGAYLSDLLADDPQASFGEKHLTVLGQNLGILVKFLDSAERLPIQVHPDKKKAKAFFQSDFGKTEAWYILGGRRVNGEDPYILLGFKEGVTEEMWQTYFDTQNIEAMQNSLHRIPVEPGQMYLVEGGTPHAIGAGVLLLEIQEPTDYTISVEKCTPQGEVLDEFMLHQGIGFERMMQCFHYEAMTRQEVLNRFKREPVRRFEDQEAEVDSLIDYNLTKAFALERITVRGEYLHQGTGTPSLLVAVSGQGRWSLGDKTGDITKGETLFLPACLGKLRLTAMGAEPLILLECLPPEI